MPHVHLPCLRHALLAFALLGAAGLAGSVAVQPAAAASQKIRFAPGAEQARYSGSIQGDDEDRYFLDAARGQELNVALRTDNPQIYFNITQAGSDTAIYNSSVEGNRYSGVLPRTGRYVIQVYMMRAAARRDEEGNYRLTVRIPASQMDDGDGGGNMGGNGGGNGGGDYADGDAGGPDNWIVVGVARNDRLNIRRGPSPSAPLVARVRNGTVLVNRGCRTTPSTRWCRVSLGNGGPTGWVNGRFLREY